MASNILQDRLDRHGISQVDLAAASGISVGTIEKTCRKRKTPAPSTQSRLVAGLSQLAGTEYAVPDIFGKQANT